MVHHVQISNGMHVVSTVIQLQIHVHTCMQEKPLNANLGALILFIRIKFKSVLTIHVDKCRNCKTVCTIVLVI